MILCICRKRSYETVLHQAMVKLYKNQSKTQVDNKCRCRLEMETYQKAEDYRDMSMPVTSNIRTDQLTSSMEKVCHSNKQNTDKYTLD